MRVGSEGITLHCITARAKKSYSKKKRSRSECWESGIVKRVQDEGVEGVAWLGGGCKGAP